MKRNRRGFVLSFFSIPGLVAVLAAPIEGRTAAASCGSTPGTTEQVRLLHQQNQRLNRARLKAYGSQAIRGVRAEGDLVVMDSGGGAVSERNAFNLDGQQIHFAPVSGGYQYQLGGESFDFALANASERMAGLGDDDTREVPLPFPFTYFGATYSSVWVNSDGNLTFGVGDSASADRSLGRFTAGAPRIAPFFADLDPSVDGRVAVLATSERFTVSWIEVPEYRSFGIGPRNTLQVTLWADNGITVSYGGVTSSAAVVGISRGRLQGQSTVVSFVNQPSGVYSSSVAERFAINPEVDIVAVAQRFFQNFEDAYDYLVIYNTLNVAAGAGAVAFEVTARNQRTGYGDRILDNGPEFGSPKRLQAVINMGQLAQYPADPNARVPARFATGDTPLSILAHEAGHLFLAFASVRNTNDPDARPMLGFQSAHWSLAFNSEASLLEGARIRDYGPGVSPRFETVATVEGYSPLDQYLMGLRAAEEVPATFLVQNAILFAGPPVPGIRFSGERRDISIEELIAAEGRRTPDWTVAQRRFRFAFVVIGPDAGPTAQQLEQIDTYRREFEPYFARVTGDRASADTRILHALRFSVQPAGGVLAGSTVTARVEAALPVEKPLRIRLQASGNAVEVPATVTIPVGQQFAEFRLRGVTPGVADLRAEAESAGWERATARIQTRAGIGELRARIAGEAAQPASRLGPVRVEAVDINNVPYPGIPLVVRASGQVTPSVPVTTDSEGGALFAWTPSAEPLNELFAGVAGSAEPPARAVALSAPFVPENGMMNAASHSPVLCPGLLVSIYGANLAPGAVVRIGERPAEILHATDRQLNVILPPDLDPGFYPFRVRTALGESEFRIIEYAPSSPGIFQTLKEQDGRQLRILMTGLGLGQDQVEVRLGLFRLPVISIAPSVSLRGVTEVLVGLPAGVVGRPEVEIRIGDQVSNRIPVELP